MEMEGVLEQHEAESEEHAEAVRFIKEAERTFREMCELARERNELAFVRTMATDLWNQKFMARTTAAETQMLFNGYLMYLDDGEMTDFKVRLMLGFYAQFACGTGYYDIPANLIEIASGGVFREWPFPLSGKDDPSSSGGVLGYLEVLAARNGHADLAGVFRELFDRELVAGYLRADYVLNEEGIHLLNRHRGTPPRVVTLPEFFDRFERAVNYFEMIRLVVAGYLTKYQRVKRVTGRDGDEPERSLLVRTDLRNRRLVVDG